MEPVDPSTLSDRVGGGAFIDVQQAAGASFYRSSSGRLWTKGFGDPGAEYRAVRQAAGLWDFSSLAKYHLSGSDVLPALDRLTTRAMLHAQAGSVRYVLTLGDDGLMLDEGTVLVLSPGEAYYLGNHANDAFWAHLVDHTSDQDVRIEHVTDRLSNISLQGPRSLAILAERTDVAIDDLGWFRLLPHPIEVGGVRAIVVRAGYTGERGYECYLLDGDEGAERLWSSLVDAGVTPIGFDAIDMLRVEAGLVMCRREYMPGETNPHDISLGRFIDPDHAFVGRDASLAMAQAPARRLVTLALEGAGAPERGGEVIDREGRPVGTVTSGVVTPGYGPLALAVIDRDGPALGAGVSLHGRPAIVRDVPIYDATKARQR